MFSIKSTINDFPKSTGKRYKIIVNSGGGLFGYIISNFMSFLDFDLYDKVDVIAGTSIGGILAMTYALNSDYKWINDSFKELGMKIFEDRNFLCFLSRPKYKNDNLKKLLYTLYGDKKLSDLKNNIIITSTDFTLGQPRIFENINLKPEQNVPLVDIGLCTSAAPTFFEAQEVLWKTLNYDINKIPINERILLLSAFERDKIIKNPNFKKSSVIFDGGMLENIPIISTYTTLHTELGIDPKDIDVFAIGTGNLMNEETYTVDEVNSWSIIKVLRKLIVPYVTDSNEQTSIFWGLQMGFNSFEFFNPVKIHGDFDDPGILKEIDKECLKYKNEFISKITDFLNK